MNKRLFSKSIGYLGVCLFSLLSFGARGQSYCEPATIPGQQNGSYTPHYFSFTTSGGANQITHSPGTASVWNDNSYGHFTGTNLYCEGQRGSSIGFYILNNNNIAQGYSIWVDWNADGTFAADERVAGPYPLYPPGVNDVSGSFAIPNTATIGTLRMRVRSKHYFGGTPYDPTPCDDLTSSGYGATSDFDFIVTAASVYGGSISGATSVCASATTTFTATVSGGTWSSSNNTVATVNASGNVTGLSAGSAVISYTVSGATSVATQSITVNPAPNAGTISGPTTVCAGSSITLSSTVTGGTWTASNGLVTTDASGLIAGNIGSSGTSTITYTVSSACGTASTTTILDVVIPANAGTLTGSDNVCVGSSIYLTQEGSTGEGPLWYFSGSAISTDYSGTIYGVEVGTTTVTYTVNNICGISSATKFITVNPLPDAGSISGTNTAVAGTSVSLIDYAIDGTWSSSDASIATVDATGNVSAVAAGSTTISYSVTNGCGTAVATMEFTVTDDLSISGPSTVCVLSPTAFTPSATGGSWSSSNTSIATVDAFGNVTGLVSGTAIISYVVAGSPAAVQSITVAGFPYPTYLSALSWLFVGESAGISGLNSGGTFSSSNDSIATIDGYGNIHGVSIGTVTFTYSLSNSCGGVSNAYRTVAVTGLEGTVGCTPFFTYGYDACAANIAILHFGVPGVGGASIDDNSGCSFAGYEDHTSLSATLTAGTTVVSNITVGTDYYTSTQVWIDFNDNGLFEGSETVGGANGQVGNFNISLSIPSAAPGGTHKMRVLTGFDIASYPDLSPCGNYNYGNAKDYMVNIVPATVDGGTITGASSVCAAATTSFSATVPGGTWSSSDVAVATVDATGNVTGLAAGTATISYSVSGATSVATQSITVNPLPDAGTISNASSIGVQDSFCATASTQYQSSVFGGIWSTSNSAVARVGAYPYADSATGNPVTVAGIYSTSTMPLGATTNINYTVTTATCGSATVSKPVYIRPFSDTGTLSLANGTTICTGQTISLTSTSVTYGLPRYNGTTYGRTWTTQNSSIASVGSSTGVITGVSAGTVNITYTTAPNGCGSFFARRRITVVAPPSGGTISGSSSVCAGATTTLTTSGTAGGTWTSNNTGIATVNASTGVVTGVSGVSGGNAVITYTVTVGSCSATATHTITVNSAPTDAGYLSGAYTVCPSTAVLLSASVPGGTWSADGDAIINPTTGLVTTNSTSNGLSTITYTISNDCGSVSTTANMQTVPNANAGTISPMFGGNLLCQYTTMNLMTTGQPYGDWISSDLSVAVVDANTGLVTGVGQGTTTIYYDVNNGCGFPSTASYEVTVQSPPHVTVGGFSDMCPGQSAYASVSLYAPGTGNWYTTDGSVAIVDGDGNVHAVGAGTVGISYSTTSSCGTASDGQLLTVHSLPNAGTLTGSDNVCVGNSITLTPTGSTGEGPLWYGSSAIVTVDNGMVTGVTAGTATISYRVNNSCGESYATKVITVNALPDAGTISGPDNICAGTNINLFATMAGGTWMSGGVATIDEFGNMYLPDWAWDGMNTVTYAVTNACGTSSTTHYVSESAHTYAGFIDAPAPICVGGMTSVYSTAPAGAWSSSNTAVADIDFYGMITGVGAGTATLTYSVGGICGDAVATATVSVNTSPDAGTITGSNMSAVGAFTAHESTIVGGAWTSSNQFIAQVDGSGMVTGMAAGNATISYTVSNDCGSTTATLEFTVTPADTVVSLPCYMPSTGIVAWYPFNNDGADMSGHGNDLSNVGGVTFATDRFGAANGAASFDGFGQHMEKAYPSIPGGNSNRTYSAWYKKSSTTANSVIFSTYDGTAGGCNTSFSLFGDNAGYYFWAKCSDRGLGYTNPLNEWIHVAVVYKDNKLYMYNNGVIANDTLNPYYTVSGGLNTVPNQLVVGSLNFSAGWISDFEGQIDEVAIYDRALTNEEILQIYGGVAIAGPSAVCQGNTLNLTTTNPGGIWSSGNVGIAAVDASGLVTAGAAGNATISYTVTTSCGDITASHAVVVNSLPDAGYISGGSMVCPSSPLALTASVSGGTWSTDGSTMVDGYGLVSVSESAMVGTSTITYTVTGDCGSSTTTYMVNIAPAANAGTISSMSGAHTVCQYGMDNLSSSGDMLGAWVSSNPSAAYVDMSTGALNGNMEGMSTISYTVTNACGVSSTATFNIEVLSVPHVIVTGIYGDMCPGNSAYASASVYAAPAGNWSTSDASVAVVDYDGNVHALGAGVATISYNTMSSCGYAGDGFNLTVNSVPDAGTISGGSMGAVGSFTSLSVSGVGGTWSSSNSFIAQVDGSGMVTGMAAGNVTISYTVSNDCGNATATIEFTVTPAEVVASVPCYMPASGLVAWYPFSGNANDYSGNGNHGVNYGANDATDRSGNANSAYNFDGASQFVDVALTTPVDLNAAAGLTISTWCKLNDLSGLYGLSLLYNSVTGEGDGFYADYSSRFLANGGIYNGVVAGNWYNIVSTTDIATNTVSLYVNGVLQSTSALGAARPVLDHLHIGKWSDYNGWYTNGKIDDISIYNRALTVAEVAQMYTAGAVAISGSSAVCQGSSVSLSATSVGGTWSSSNAAVASVDASGIVSSVASGSATISYALTTGCGEAIATHPITVINGNILTADTIICNGQTITLSAIANHGSFGTGAYYNGHSYYRVTPTIPVSWAEANTAANAAGGHLVTITDAGEQAFFGPMVTVQGWIGLFQNHSSPSYSEPAGGWEWVTGEPFVYNNWASGEPNNNNVGLPEDFGNAYDGGIWNDYKTAGYMSYFLEFDYDDRVDYTWSTGATTLSVTVAPSATTAYVLTTTSGSVTCLDTVNVTVNPLPNAGSISGAVTAIAGTSVTLATTGSGGTWSSNNTSIASVNALAVVAALSAGTAFVSYTATNACGTASTAAPFTVTPAISGLPCYMPSAGLIGWYPFNNNGTDVSGSGNSLSNVGAVTYTTDRFGNANSSASFNGTASQYMRKDLPSFPAGNADRSYSVWYKNTAHAFNSVLFSTDRGSSTICDNSFSLFTDTTGYYLWTKCRDKGTAQRNLLNEWTHVVVVNRSSKLFVYKNGLIINDTTDPYYVLASMNTTPGKFTVGGIQASDVAFARPFKGQIDDIAVYNRALSATEIARMFTGGVAIEGPLATCVGGSAGLSATSSGGTWSSSDATVATVDASGVVYGVAVGVASISYSVAGVCGMGDVSRSITVNDSIVTSTLTGASTLCSAPVVLSAGVSGGTWSSSNNALATVSHGVVTGLSAGDVIITYTLTNGCGSSVTTQNMNVISFPAPISGPTTVCMGASITLVNATTGGVWSSASTRATVNAEGVVTGVSAGLVTISYTNCGGTRTYPITVLTTPVAIAGPSTICEGTATSFTNATAGGTWTTTDAGIAAVTSTSPVMVTGVAIGTTSVNYAIGTCAVSRNITVNVSPAAMSTPAPVCVGTAVTLSNTVPGGTWSSTASTKATVSADGVVTALTAGSATIKYSIGSCVSSVPFTVNITPVAITGTNTICEGAVTTFSNVTAGGTWSTADAGIANVTVTSPVTITGVAAGTTAVSYSIGSCTVTRNITVNTAPAAMSTPATVCIGTAVTLSNPIPGGTWTSTAPTKATVSADGVVTALSAGTSNIKYSIGSCVASIPFTVNITPKPITGTNTICEGAVTTFSNTVVGGTWITSDAGVAAIDASSAVGVTGISAGTATITYSIGSCSVSRDVIVNTAPAAMAAPAPVCVGTVVTLSNPVSGGTWTTTAPTKATVSSDGAVYAVSAGSTTVKYSIGTCVSSVLFTVNVTPKPITGTNVICEGAATTFSNTVAGGVWSTGDAGIASVNASSPVTISGISNGVTAMSYTIGSCTATRDITVNITPAAMITPAPVCIGTTVTLTNATPGGVWSTAYPTRATISTSGVVQAIGAGVSTIKYTLNGCVSSVPYTVSPTPTGISGLNTVCRGSSVTWTPNVTGGVWTTANAAIATVNSGLTNLMTGVTTGTTTITYTVGSCFMSKVLTVGNCGAKEDDVTGNGVEVADNTNNVSVFPNPATNRINIKASVPVNVKLFTPDGKLVMTQADAHELAVDNLASGVYIMMIYDENNILLKTERLVKMD